MSRIGTGFRKCSFSRPDRRVDDQSRLFEQAQVLHDPEARHFQFRLELGERPAVTFEQPVEQEPTRRVGQRLEHPVVVGTMKEE